MNGYNMSNPEIVNTLYNIIDYKAEIFPNLWVNIISEHRKTNDAKVSIIKWIKN